EKERQARREINRADGKRLALGGVGAGSRPRRFVLDAEQKRGRRQDAAKTPLDAKVEVAVGTARAIEVEERGDLCAGGRPPIRTARQCAENTPRAPLFVRRCCGPANEDPPAAGRVARSRRLVRTTDEQTI